MTKRLLALGFTIVATHLFAQLPIDGVHYPVGLGGIKAGIPDAPGIYLRDDNWIYTASANQPAGFNTVVYMQAPQVMWLTGWQVIGANIGADLMVPFIYREMNYKPSVSSLPGGGFPTASVPSHYGQFGIGDIKIEPLVLAWHWDQVDMMAAGGVWAPTGDYTPGAYDNLGDGEWSPMITLGAVWYPDEAKTWSLSILHHYEFNETQDGPPVSTGSAPGGGFPNATSEAKVRCSTYTLECAASKTIFDHTDLGVNGYFQKQFSGDSSLPNPNKDSAVAGAGPEVSVRVPSLDLTASLSYDYEFVAHDRPRGHVIDLSVTKRF